MALPACPECSAHFLRNPLPRGILPLQKLVRRNGDDDFPGLWIDEIRQRKEHAIADPGNDADDRQKAEQTGHSGELTIQIKPDRAGPSTNMFPSMLQESLARASPGVV